MARLDSAAQRLRSWLGSPRATIGVVLFSTLLTLPSLRNGLAADDTWHRIMLTRDPRWGFLNEPWYELFTFFDGNLARTQGFIDMGVASWWTAPELRVSFFRPLSAGTHALDYLLWPTTPWLMHAQSLGWYTALVAVAAWVYRRVLDDRGSRWVPALAALLYGLDHNHGVPVGWVANRNALVAGTFALASLGAHDVAARGRRGGAPDNERAWAIASALLLALALSSGEVSLAIVGFFFAHALFLDKRGWGAKVLALAPQAVVLGAWAVVYRLGHFGVRGSSIYVDPLREPALFAAALVKHVPLLVAAELGAPAPDLYTFVPLPAKVAFMVLACGVLAWSSVALVRLYRAEASARFFLVGAVIATVPACATAPAGRLLVVSGFGLIGLVALAGAGVLDGAAWLPLPSERLSRRLVRSFALWACGAHLVLSPLLMQLTMLQMLLFNDVIVRMGTEIPVGPEAETKRLVMMNAPDTMFIPYVVMSRRVDGELVPARLLTLAGGARDVDLTRTDERTVVVRVASGFFRTGTEVITRNEHQPLPVGSRVHVEDIELEVLRTAEDGVPTEVAFRFPTSADDPGLLWMRWEGKKLRLTTPPRIGERVTYPGQLPVMW